MQSKESDINEIMEQIVQFSEDRDWDQFHNGKDLALALSIEASELNEAFLWKSAEDVKIDKMEPTIHDGDYCVFRANPVGSRQGKIVLTQHINFYDGDNVGNYSIKTYTSLKKYSETGEWEHEKIVLEPKNKDYKSISIDNVDCNEFKVIGEFIGIIKP